VLDFLPEFLRTPVAFVIVLGVLVFIHELGHYLAARLVGVHVEAFSIGFGRALYSWVDRRGTVWKLAWLPLGGYVKLHGQERPEDQGEEARAQRIPGRTFLEKPVWRRAVVIVAGPAANFVLAAVLFAGLYGAAGKPMVAPVVGEVVAGSAAASAGLKAGDRVLEIAGTRITRFEELQRIIASHPGAELGMLVRRDGAALKLSVTPAPEQSGGRTIGLLGVRGSVTEFTPVPVWEALPLGAAKTWEVTEQTMVGLWRIITTSAGADDLGGPLRIAQLSGQVAQYGLASLIGFIAVLSVNLALINLFPVPILDGGHLMFLLAEALRGRPLPPRAQEYGLRAGFALLIGLFVFATWNDLGHLGLFRWVAGLGG
jgi:regulator of sigma E protease